MAYRILGADIRRSRCERRTHGNHHLFDRGPISPLQEAGRRCLRSAGRWAAIDGPIRRPLSGQRRLAHLGQPRLALHRLPDDGRREVVAKAGLRVRGARRDEGRAAREVGDRMEGARCRARGAQRRRSVAGRDDSRAGARRRRRAPSLPGPHQLPRRSDRVCRQVAARIGMEVAQHPPPVSRSPTTRDPTREKPPAEPG